MIFETQIYNKFMTMSELAKKGPFKKSIGHSLIKRNKRIYRNQNLMKKIDIKHYLNNQEFK